MVLLAGFVVYYLVTRNNTQAGPEITTASGLKMQDLRVGDGESPQPGQTIKVSYVGTLEDGTEFDNSYKKAGPVDFRIGVGQVIKGWDEGVMGMKVGGKRKLFVPSALGYAARPRPNIPPNSNLIFEIELLDVK
jgi:FKBP-type peptidyl-prolyl cis-trans isomerase